MNSFFTVLPMIHSIRAVVICAQSTSHFFKLAQGGGGGGGGGGHGG